ncbi:glycosyl hydrolase family 95 catalytic domain-containing protein [Paenibacillus puerhi]|uniref:glycosyl hydrolase family 95 catalytic domain-containing protein n=1 Tax=Paenibacillus puerhi TaxID=2692622 RepID=UPI001F22649F|nr:glycoside hydrolase N-terminal domain-containing protein [Paenibacillus puerhi]
MQKHMEARTCGKDRLVMSYPASWWRNMWREALPSGNGVLGASVFGGVHEETVLLGHAKLWHWGRRDELPDVSGTLKLTRKLMDEERYAEASWKLADALKENGYGTRLASRFPLAAIRLEMPCGNAFQQYSRSLDMATGEVEVSWRDGARSFRRRLFVSRADDAVVYAIGGEDAEAGALHGAEVGDGGRNGEKSPGSVSGEIGLVLHPSDRWADTPEFKELESSIETGSDDSYVWYAGRNDDGTDFGAVMLVRREAGRAEPGEGAVRFEGVRDLLVLVKVFVEGERERDWARLKQELALLAAEASYDRLMERHAALHGPLYRSASLELEPELEPETCGQGNRSNERLLLDAYEGQASAELIRKMWAYGRYLFLSGTADREDAAPFGLYGLWGGDYRLVWSHNMANENIQMMYWHAHVGGMGSLVPSLFRYYNEMMDDFRNNARMLYGCRGIYIPAGTTPGIGVPNQIVPVILNWTGAAGWLARHYAEHFRFTQDMEFLRHTAIPFLREALMFYEDFLVEDEEGRYRMYPSVSPENTPLNFMPPDGKQLAHPMPTAVNATMDVAIVKELLHHLIEANRAAGGDPAEERRWQQMLEKLPAYRINSDGAVSEWIHPGFEDRYAHRHLSHLYPVFPGYEVTQESDPELFEAFAQAVRLREIGAQSGWSLAHMASVYARLGDGDSSLESLDLLTRSCLLPNFFTLHNDWRGMGISMKMPTAPVQLDANLGWVNAVQEMLLQVSPGLVKLLPARPERWRRGRFGDWRFHTGRVSVEWNLDDGSWRAEFIAESDTELTVRLPEEGRTPGITAIKEAKALPSELGASYYCVVMKSGSALIFSQKGGS